MTLHQLKRSLILPAPMEKVFPFFAQPENLEKLTPPKLSFSILTPSPVPMHVGSIIHYKLKLGGIPFSWITAIAEFVPNSHFVDVMLKGPYAFWHHKHTFRSTEGGTEIGDIVTYALPFGPLGEIAHSLKVERDLNYIFDYRKEVIPTLINC